MLNLKANESIEDIISQLKSVSHDLSSLHMSISPSVTLQDSSSNLRMNRLKFLSVDGYLCTDEWTKLIEATKLSLEELKIKTQIYQWGLEWS